MTWEDLMQSNNELVLEYNPKYDKSSIEEVENKCMQNDPVALYEMAARYYLGCDGVEENKNKALMLYSKVLEYQRNVGALNHMGLLFEEGICGEDKKDHCVKCYELGSRWGSGDASENLAILYDAGKYVEQDGDKAEELYKLSISQGNKHAYLGLGIMYEEKKLYEKARYFYQKAIENKVSEKAYMYLADVYKEEGNGEKALQFYKLAYEHENEDAACEIAFLYWRGDLVEEDNIKAFEWFTTVKKDGNVGANYYLAILYIDGIKNYLTPDLDKALELLNDVLENQIPETYALKGEIFLKKDMRNEAKKWFTKSAELGNENAKKRLERWDNLSQDMHKQHLYDLAHTYTIEQLIEAYNSGDTDAILHIGFAYRKGIKGAQKNQEKAEVYFNKLVELGGDYASQGYFNIGAMYFFGDGVRKDYAKAVNSLKKSAELKNGAACALLGSLYEEGKIVHQDYEEALRLYTIASENGETECYKRAAKIYLVGKIKEGQNIGLAIDNLQKYLEKYPQDAWSNYIMGIFYESGVSDNNRIILKADEDKALQMLSIASQNGYAEASKKLGEFFSKDGNPKKDVKKALDYYELAWHQGDELSASQVAALNLLPDFQGESYINHERGIRAAKDFLLKGQGQFGLKEILMSCMLGYYDKKQNSTEAVEGYKFIFNELPNMNLAYSTEERKKELTAIIKYVLDKLLEIQPADVGDEVILGILSQLNTAAEKNPYINQCSKEILGEKYFALGEFFLKYEELEKSKALFEKAAWKGYEQAEEMLQRFHTSLFGKLTFK